MRDETNPVLVFELSPLAPEIGAQIDHCGEQAILLEGPGNLPS